MAGVGIAQSDAPSDPTVPADSQAAPELKPFVMPPLVPGMPAPPLRLGDWLLGSPINELKKGRVYVIDFFISYLHESRTFTKPFEDLNRKYGRKATFFAVSVMEHDQGDVTSYVKALQGKVTYGIALDDQALPTDGHGHMSVSWLSAAAVENVPVVFIVDKDGNIAWHGDPSETDGVLEQVLDGKWDTAAFVAKFKGQLEDLRAKYIAWQKSPVRTEIQKVRGMISDQDLDGALAELDTLAAMDGTGALISPAKEAVSVGLEIYAMKRDLDGYYTEADKALDVYADDPDELNNLAWGIANPDGQMPDKRWDFAIKAASKAVDISKRQNEAFLDTLAWAYFGSGDKDKAIATEKEAVSVADDVDRVDMLASLDRLEKAAAAPAPAPPKSA